MARATALFQLYGRYFRHQAGRQKEGSKTAGRDIYIAEESMLRAPMPTCTDAGVYILSIFGLR
jgi:hypothetical protein